MLASLVVFGIALAGFGIVQSLNGPRSLNLRPERIAVRSRRPRR